MHYWLDGSSTPSLIATDVPKASNDASSRHSKRRNNSLDLPGSHHSAAGSSVTTSGAAAAIATADQSTVANSQDQQRRSTWLSAVSSEGGSPTGYRSAQSSIVLLENELGPAAALAGSLIDTAETTASVAPRRRGLLRQHRAKGSSISGNAVEHGSNKLLHKGIRKGGSLRHMRKHHSDSINTSNGSINNMEQQQQQHASQKGYQTASSNKLHRNSDPLTTSPYSDAHPTIETTQSKPNKVGRLFKKIGSKLSLKKQSSGVAHKDLDEISATTTDELGHSGLDDTAASNLN